MVDTPNTPAKSRSYWGPTRHQALSLPTFFDSCLFFLNANGFLRPFSCELKRSFHPSFKHRFQINFLHKASTNNFKSIDTTSLLWLSLYLWILCNLFILIMSKCPGYFLHTHHLTPNLFKVTHLGMIFFPTSLLSLWTLPHLRFSDRVSILCNFINLFRKTSTEILQQAGMTQVKINKTQSQPLEFSNSIGRDLSIGSIVIDFIFIYFTLGTESWKQKTATHFA